MKGRPRVAKTYEGNPCKHGHTERYVSNRCCVICQRGQASNWSIVNRERRNSISETYRVKNLERERKRKAKWRHDPKNIEKVKGQWQRGYERNGRHLSSLRRARKMNQTPSWADLDKIKEIYSNCPEGYEVDHIHPLSKGGLHVHYNLQYLTIHENRVKYSKIL